MTLVSAKTNLVPSQRPLITLSSTVTGIQSNRQTSGEAKRALRQLTMISCAMHTKFSAQILIHRKFDKFCSNFVSRNFEKYAFHQTWRNLRAMPLQTSRESTLRTTSTVSRVARRKLRQIRRKFTTSTSLRTWSAVSTQIMTLFFVTKIYRSDFSIEPRQLRIASVWMKTPGASCHKSRSWMRLSGNSRKRRAGFMTMPLGHI